MQQWIQYALGLFCVVCMGVLVIAQTEQPYNDDPSCTPSQVATQQETFAQLLTFDFDNQPDLSRDNLYRLGALYQQLAVNCGYQPSEQEIDALIQLTLSLTDVETVLAANAVGDDVDAILAELETVNGDVFNGQLLYNSIEPSLDGGLLGCAGCHLGEVAPLTEGTWTRTHDIRLNDPALAGYDVTRYLVESIVQPDVYIAPDYMPQLMPQNFGNRLDLQQLADIIAYLESQDQLLEDLDE